MIYLSFQIELVATPTYKLLQHFDNDIFFVLKCCNEQNIGWRKEQRVLQWMLKIRVATLNGAQLDKNIILITITYIKTRLRLLQREGGKVQNVVSATVAAMVPEMDMEVRWREGKNICVATLNICKPA